MLTPARAGRRSRWRDWFEGMALMPEPGDRTLLSGALADQAALHGLLKRLRDLGVAIVSNALGVAVGLAGIVTLAPGLASFGIVFGLGQLVWFAWLGGVLLRGSAPAAAPRPVAAGDAA